MFTHPRERSQGSIPPKRAASFGANFGDRAAVPKMDLLTRQEALIVFPEYFPGFFPRAHKGFTEALRINENFPCKPSSVSSDFLGPW